MRNKEILRGKLYKGLRKLGMDLPTAVKSVKKYERGDLSLMDILLKCGRLEEMETYDEWHCDLCNHDNYSIDYKIVRPSGLEILVSCYCGCTGMELRKIKKNELVYVL